MANPDLKGWYDEQEAADYLSREIGRKIEPETVLYAAIHSKGMQLFLYIPPDTTDRYDRPMSDGLWILITEQTDKGTPARQHISKLLRQGGSFKGITGAYVKQHGDKQSPRQLKPRGWPTAARGAFPKGSSLAFKKKDLDGLVTKIKKQTSKAAPAIEATQQKSGNPDQRERSTYLKLIAALAEHGGVPLTGIAFEKATEFLGSAVRVNCQVAEETIDRIYEEADMKGWSQQLPPREKQ